MKIFKFAPPLIFCLLAAGPADAALIVNLGNAQNDPLQIASSTTVNNISESSTFTTGTFTVGTGVSFTLNTTATNGNLTGQDVGWGVSGGSDNAGIDNGSSGLEALNFTISNITGLAAGQSLVFQEFGVRFSQTGGNSEFYTVNGGSEVAFANNSAVVSLANLASLSVGAGSSGNTGFALDFITVDVIPEPSAALLGGLGLLALLRRRRA